MTTDNRTNEPTNEALRKALNVAREHFSAIAASGEIKVWEDTGEKRGIDYQAKVWAERGARLASEALAATRVPVQGEPNDDREARVKRIILESLVFTNESSDPWAQLLTENILAALDGAPEEGESK